MAEPRTRTRIARGLFAALLATAAALGVGEVVARLFGPDGEPPALRFEFASKVDGNLDEGGLLVRSETLFWEPRPGAEIAPGDRINAHGLRGPELAAGDGASFRIALLGDSCTFGFRVPHAWTYGARLEALLRSTFPARSVQVLNAGVPGYSIVQGRRRFEEDVLPLQPDAAVLYFGAWNDFNPAMGDGRNDVELARGAGADLPSRAYALLRHSRLFELLALRYAGTLRYRHWRATLDAWLEGEPPGGYRVPLDDFERLFAGLLDRCAELDTPALVVLPELDAVRRAAEPVHGTRLDAYRAVMRSAAGERGVPVVDQRELYSGLPHGELYLDLVHPRPRGYYLLARALA